MCVSCNFRDCNFFACGRAVAEGFILWFLQTLLSSVFLCCFAFFFFLFFVSRFWWCLFFITVFFFSLVVSADFLKLILVWTWCLSSYSLIVCGGESCMYFGPVTKENLWTIVASARRGKDCSSSKFPLTCNNLFLIFWKNLPQHLYGNLHFILIFLKFLSPPDILLQFMAIDVLVPTRFVLMDGRSWPFYCVHEADVWNVKSSGHWSWDYKHISSSRKFNVKASNIWLGLLIRVFEEFSGTLMSPVSRYSSQSCGVQRSKIPSKLL